MYIKVIVLQSPFRLFKILIPAFFSCSLGLLPAISPSNTCFTSPMPSIPSSFFHLICLSINKYLMPLKFSKTKIAEILGINREILYNKISQFPRQDQIHFKTYTGISDRDLDEKIRSIKQVW